MNIGEVARRAGLETSAIRYYERVGVLPAPERINGRRRYGEDALDLLALVQFARAVGFSIREVKALFGHEVASEPVSGRWRKLARAKLEEIAARKQQLHMMQVLLEKTLACACVAPRECGRRIRAHATKDPRRSVRRARQRPAST